TTNPPPAGCPGATTPGLGTAGIVPTFGTNFHTSYMPLIAAGCTGTLSCEGGQTIFDPATGNHVNTVCDVGNGVCRPDTSGNGVAVSCTPATGQTTCVPAGAAYPSLTALTQPDPYPPSKLSVFVFEDDFPLNGEQDGGGGIDVLSQIEPGLGGFNITLFDDAGGTGDATGQMTYDMFNQPLVNALAGTIDPATGLDACPVAKISRIGPQ